MTYYQGLSRRWFTNVFVRWFFALCILASFIIDAVETQILPLGRDTADGISRTGKVFFLLELYFTILFGLELSWNMFSYWFWAFFSDAWSLFDFAVVLSSIISVGTEGANVKSIRMVRILRALRVVSQFKSLRKIVRALTQAAQPVLSAMFVAVIVISVFSILGVNFYAERAPERFGDFGRSSWTLVTSATMEGWVEVCNEIMEGDDLSQLDSGVIVFFMTYIILVAYVLTSIIVAVLLENFAEASRAEDEADLLEAQNRTNVLALGMSAQKNSTGFSPLDPLLSELVQVETLDQLNAQLTTLFEVLDVDASGELSFDEIQLGLQAFHLRPRIQITHEDFQLISQHGKLTNADGIMTQAMFCEMMMYQVRDFIGRSMSRQALLPQNQRAVSSIFAGLNWLMMMSLKEEGNVAKEEHVAKSKQQPRSQSLEPASPEPTYERPAACDPITKQALAEFLEPMAEGQAGAEEKVLQGWELQRFGAGVAPLSSSTQRLQHPPNLLPNVPPMYVSLALCMTAVYDCTCVARVACLYMHTQLVHAPLVLKIGRRKSEA